MVRTHTLPLKLTSLILRLRSPSHDSNRQRGRDPMLEGARETWESLSPNTPFPHSLQAFLRHPHPKCARGGGSGGNLHHTPPTSRRAPNVSQPFQQSPPPLITARSFSPPPHPLTTTEHLGHQKLYKGKISEAERQRQPKKKKKREVWGNRFGFPNRLPPTLARTGPRRPPVEEAAHPSPLSRRLSQHSGLPLKVPPSVTSRWEAAGAPS